MCGIIPILNYFSIFGEDQRFKDPSQKYLNIVKRMCLSLSRKRPLFVRLQGHLSVLPPVQDRRAAVCCYRDSSVGRTMRAFKWAAGLARGMEQDESPSREQHGRHSNRGGRVGGGSSNWSRVASPDKYYHDDAFDYGTGDADYGG